MSFLEELRLNFRLADLADILVVSILLYLGLQWLRRRAARAIAAALIVLALVYLCARVFNLYLTLLAFQTGLTFLIVSLVVIFQQDIRRAFEQLSSWRGFHPGRAAEKWSSHIDDLIETTAALANQKIGALMVLEGQQPLGPHIEGGVAVKGKISTPLLISIFHPATPGHDGAVVIDRDKIALLGAYLPLSHNLRLIGKGGTRHAAALGLSEVCDALVIVVSEERGTISLAEAGQLQVVDSIAALKDRLDAFYLGKHPLTHDHTLQRRLRRNLPLLAASTGLAAVLWFFAAYPFDSIQRIEEAQIDFRNTGRNTVKAEPAKIKVTLAGSKRAFNSFEAKDLKLSIDMQGYQEGEHTIELKDRFLSLPAGLAVRQFETPAVKVSLYHATKTIDLVVDVKPVGAPPKGFLLERVDVSPAKVSVQFPDLGKPFPTSVGIKDTIFLKEYQQTALLKKELDLPPEAVLVGGQTPEVQITLRIKRKDS